MLLSFSGGFGSKGGHVYANFIGQEKLFFNYTLICVWIPPLLYLSVHPLLSLSVDL